MAQFESTRIIAIVKSHRLTEMVNKLKDVLVWSHAVDLIKCNFRCHQLVMVFINGY